jgi:hypothetical protein
MSGCPPCLGRPVRVRFRDATLAAFATGFHAHYGVLVGFAEPDSPRPQPVQLGGLNLVPLHWLADPASTPETAADGLLVDVSRWVTE